MLTWETLTKHIENGCMDDDLRLVAQLLIEAESFYLEMAEEHCKYPKPDIKTRFEIVRHQAMTNSIEHFQQHFPRVQDNG